jgi:hypothetical protein
MSEKQDLTQAASDKALPQPKSKMTLVNSLIILVIIYLVSGLGALFATPKASSLVPWLELVQWVLVITWLLVGVRPPFMEWRRQSRENNQ